MVNPHWPHLPKRKDEYDNDDEEEGIEGAWTTIPDDPLDYHFYYHILDGDEGGRPPKIVSSEGHKQTDNEYFNLRDKSCLHLIADSNNKVIIKSMNFDENFLLFLFINPKCLWTTKTEFLLLLNTISTR